MSHMPRARRPGWVATLALLLVVLAGCGGAKAPSAASAPQSGDITVTPGPDGVQAVTLVTEDNFRFVPARFHVTPGPVSLTLRNPSSVVHSLKFDPGGPTENIPLVNTGQSDTINFTVTTPGEYSFVCTFHAALNQRGTMIVQ